MSNIFDEAARRADEASARASQAQLQQEVVQAASDRQQGAPFNVIVVEFRQAKKDPSELIQTINGSGPPCARLGGQA